jgi:HEAT repeat protein/putative zinc finger protein
MNCERVREQIPELLAGRLDSAARESVVEHLETCAACRSEVAELNTVWRGMENLNDPAGSAPDPSAKARFLEVLQAYQAGMGVAQTASEPRVIAFPRRPVWRAALAAGLLFGGVLLGRYQFQPQPGSPEVAQLKGQVENLRQMVALSMLQQQSPSARMRGVTYTEQMSQPDREVADALLAAINNDSSVSVRLSAVDALQKFAADPRVVPGILAAIPSQESPMVQIALIDMLVQLNARSASTGLKRLSTDPQLDEMVRQRAAWALPKLEAIR